MILPAPSDVRLARLIRASAAQFSTIFEKVQRQPPEMRLEALPESVVGQELLIAHGVAYARANGWIEHLLIQCVVDSVAEPDLAAEAERQGLISHGSSLQAIHNYQRGFGQAGVEAEAIPRIIRQVCRVDIGGEPRGTGFLVRPDMVMTAYHVVRPMIEDGTAKAGSSPRIKMVFDDHSVIADGFTERLRGRVISVAADDKWLAYASACHEQELLGQLPNDLALLAGRFDFVLVRLAGVARVGLPPVQFEATGRLRNDDFIHIFQHPAGRALSVDRQQVTEIVGADVRFYHKVSTEPGSSGSPCFNNEYRVVGMHQAGPLNGPAAALDPQSRNRGVPAFHAVAMLKALPASSPRLNPLAELTETRPGHPVFGRAETQEWVWNEVERPSRPILALSGSIGGGKTFTYDIVRSLLPSDTHDVLMLNAVDIASHEPESFAQHLIDQLGYPYAPLPEDHRDTTQLRWRKETLLQELVRSLDAGRRLDGKGAAAAKPRGVWILIDDLEKASIGNGSGISDFLYAFYASGEHIGWLHFVLLGFDGDLPATHKKLAIEREIPPPSDEDLRNYLFAKVPPRYQASLPDFAPGMVRLARMETKPSSAPDNLIKLQAKLATIVLAFSQDEPESGNG